MNRALLTGAAALAMTFGAAAGLAAGNPPPPEPGTPPVQSFNALATTYSSRASFNAAAGAITTDNFEFTPTNTTVPSMPFASGSYTSATTGTTYALSTLPAPGYNGPVDLNLLDSTYLPSTGSYIGSAYHSDVLGSNYSAVTFTFDHAITAFGLDFGTFGQAFADKSQNVAFTVAGLGTQTEYSTAHAATFFGFSSLVGFTSITIDTGVNTQRVYDNVSISAALAAGTVPEPTTWAMFIGGFGLIGGALRRRRTSVAFA